MFPRSAVASISGIGSFAGAKGGVLFQRVTGRILDANGNDYAPILFVTAWSIIQILAPTLAPARLKELP